MTEKSRMTPEVRKERLLKSRSRQTGPLSQGPEEDAEMRMESGGRGGGDSAKHRPVASLLIPGRTREPIIIWVDP